jgi:uncharacterized protein YndB with AHSA1/START domain
MVITNIQSFLFHNDKNNKFKKTCKWESINSDVGSHSNSFCCYNISLGNTQRNGCLEQIKVSREISTPVDQVWNIVSDIDNETKYWSTSKNIKNIKKTDDIIEREVTVRAGPQDAKTHQFVTVNPEQMLIQTNITEGPVTGSKVITLTPLSDNITKVDVLWNLDLSSIPTLVRGFAKDNFMKTTEEALGKISQAAQ